MYDFIKSVYKICIGVMVGNLILSIGMSIYLCISFGGYHEAMEAKNNINEMNITEQFNYMVECWNDGIRGF